MGYGHKVLIEVGKVEQGRFSGKHGSHSNRHMWHQFAMLNSGGKGMVLCAIMNRIEL